MFPKQIFHYSKEKQGQILILISIKKHKILKIHNNSYNNNSL